MREQTSVDVAVVPGARPNFVRVAPLLQAIEERAGRRALFVVTGQHRQEMTQQQEGPPPDSWRAPRRAASTDPAAASRG